MSTLIAALLLLLAAPFAMAVCHGVSKRRKERRQVRRLADEVETWLVIRHRG